MFSEGVIVMLLTLLFWSVLTRHVPLFLLSLALLLAGTLSILWSRLSLVGVDYRRRFSRRQAAFGEEVELEVEILNRKLLPLAWLEVLDDMPANLPPAQGRVAASRKPGRAFLVNLLALRPFERVRRRFLFPCTARGEHVFGPAWLCSGDLFGFIPSERALEREDTLVVYPRVVPLTQLGLPARHPLGDLRTQSWLFEDVSRTAGVREYRPGDGLRRIHWPASARAQQLQTRVYEATTSHKLVIFLDVAAAGGEAAGLDHDPDVLELTITTAASLAVWGLEQGYQTGVYTNGRHRGRRGRVTVEAQRDTGQVERILLALGKLRAEPAEPLEGLLAAESRRLPFGATVVVVAPTLSPLAAAEVEALRGRGYAVTAVLTGRDEGYQGGNGVTVRRVGPPEAWQELPAISLVGGNGHAG